MAKQEELRKRQETVVYDDAGLPRSESKVDVSKVSLRMGTYYATFDGASDWVEETHSVITIQVIHYFLKRIPIEQMVFSLTKDVRRRVMERFKITRMTLYNALKELMERDVIARVYDLPDGEQGIPVLTECEYAINPTIYWRGEMYVREQRIVEYMAYKKAWEEGRGK